MNHARKYKPYIPKGWTAQKIETLKRLYRHNSAKILALIIQRPVDDIENTAKWLGLK